eukprot:8063973-Pyramimonas_sp.AAC.1
MAKPDGDGLRPIALICSLMRVWARLRQPLAKQWEEHTGPSASGVSGIRSVIELDGNTLCLLRML